MTRYQLSYLTSLNAEGLVKNSLRNPQVVSILHTIKRQMIYSTGQQLKLDITGPQPLKEIGLRQFRGSTLLYIPLVKILKVIIIPKLTQYVLMN